MDKAVRATEPVTLEIAKAHCRIDTTDEDDLLTMVYIPAGRDTVEQYTGRTLLAQPMVSVSAPLPNGRGFALPVLPASDLTSLEAIAADGSLTVIDIAEYGARIMNGSMCAFVVSDTPLPAAEGYKAAYTGGYADGTIPPGLMLAMLDFIGDAYENREAQQAGVALQRNPRAVALMDPYRITFGM
jgi:uncharacterized phiE125 gp8 family phage protein